MPPLASVRLAAASLPVWLRRDDEFIAVARQMLDQIVAAAVQRRA